MGISETLDILEKVESRLNNYWNFYTVVVVAVCGWLITQNSDQIPIDYATAHFLAFGTVLFFFMNLAVIRAATIRLMAFENELMRNASNCKDISSQLREYLASQHIKMRLGFTYATHISMDIVVILFIYWSAK